MYLLILKFTFMGKEWISTFKLLHYLYDHPNKEKECRLYLGSCLASTHYCFFDSQTQKFMHSRDWNFEPFTISEALKTFGDALWRIEQ